MGEDFEDFEENKLRVSILYFAFSRYIGSDTVALNRLVDEEGWWRRGASSTHVTITHNHYYLIVILLL